MPAGSSLPSSLFRALSRPVPPGSLADVEHVVFVMLENRSFDHYFGRMRGVRGFGDRNAVSTRAWRPIFEQDGVLPFSVREAAERAGADPMLLDTHDHTWLGTQNAWAMGWNDAWAPNKGPGSMAYYDRADLPFHYELADTFTICDAYHCSLLTSTTPNRNYHMTGYTGYEPGTRQRALDNVASEGAEGHPGYDWVTVPELLTRAGHTWQVYQEWDNYECNNLEFFRPFVAVMDRIGLGSMRSFYEKVRAAEDPAPLLAELAERVAALEPADRDLYDRALRRAPAGGLGDWFAADVAAGRLPEVSYVVPSLADSEHPEGSSAVEGGRVLHRLLDALGSHPEVWARTALFVTYDENDGFFDHVPPPVPPDGTPEEFVGGRPMGLGIRVPMIVVSPWTVGGYVCSETFDHTSTVRFLERRFGITAPIGEWRRRVAGDLTSAFGFTTPVAATPVEAVAAPRRAPAGDRWYPRTPDEQRMPIQEPGVKPARALPYQPDAEAVVRGRSVEITMRNSGTASAHFILYGHLGELAKPMHFDVLGAAEEVVYFPCPAYDLLVVGPNGFRREFRGGMTDPVEVTGAIDAAARAVTVVVKNLTATPVEAAFAPVAYGGAARTVPIAPGDVARVEWPAPSGWYDLTVGVTGHDGFARRLMGHIENGRPSVTG